MRTKLLSMRELQEGARGIQYIIEAIGNRMADLTSVSVLSPAVVCYIDSIFRHLFSAETRSRETIPKLRFWDRGSSILVWVALPYGMHALQFRFCHKLTALWSVDYVRSLDSQIVPCEENENENQIVQPGDFSNHEYKDGLSLDYSVYDGPITVNISNCPDVDSPMKDMYAVC